MSDNPFDSPRTDPKVRQPYPKSVLLAQFCGISIAVWEIVEGLMFVESENPAHTMLPLAGLGSLIAITLLSIPSMLALIGCQTYFSLCGVVLLTLMLSPLIAPNPRETPLSIPVAFGLVMLIPLVMLSQSARDYYYPNNDR